MLMDALRGKNLNDDDTAVAGLEMRLVDVGAGVDGADVLPYDYNPAALKRFFGKRPMSVLTRVFQVASVGSGFLFILFLFILIIL